MAVIYARQNRDGLNNLYALGLKYFQAKKDKENLIAQFEYDKNLKQMDYDRKDTVRDRTNSGQRKGLLSLYGNPASAPSQAIPTSPGMPPYLAKDMLPQPSIASGAPVSPVAPPLTATEAISRVLAAGTPADVIPAVMEMFNANLGGDRARYGQDQFARAGEASGLGAGSYVPLFNPKGVSFTPADQTKLKNDRLIESGHDQASLGVAGIAANASKYGADRRYDSSIYGSDKRYDSSIYGSDRQYDSNIYDADQRFEGVKLTDKTNQDKIAFDKRRYDETGKELDQSRIRHYDALSDKHDAEAAAAMGHGGSYRNALHEVVVPGKIDGKTVPTVQIGDLLSVAKKNTELGGIITPVLKNLAEQYGSKGILEPGGIKEMCNILSESLGVLVLPNSFNQSQQSSSLDPMDPGYQLSDDELRNKWGLK